MQYKIHAKKTILDFLPLPLFIHHYPFQFPRKAGVDRSSNNVGSRGHTVRPEDKESGDDFGSDAESDFSIDSEAVRVAAEEDSAGG